MGNRPDALNTDEKERLEEFEEFRARWVIIWVFCNSLFSYVMTSVDDNGNANAYYYFLVLSAIGMIILMIRVLGGIVYVFVECCKKRMKVENIVARPKRRDSTMGNLIKGKEQKDRGVLIPENKVKIKEEQKEFNQLDKSSDILIPPALDNSNISEHERLRKQDHCEVFIK